VVNVSNLILSSISAISDTCSKAHGSITVDAANGFGPYNYQWSNIGANTTTNENLTAGTYLVTVTDNFGCSATSSIVVSNIPLPILSVTNVIDDHCNLGLGQATISASGGTGIYSYDWHTIPAQTGSIASNLTSGSYVVYVNDEYCSDSAIVTIGNIPGPIANASYNLTSDGIVSFVDQSIGASQWLWNFGNNQSSSQQNPIFNYQNSGNYNVILQVTDNFGCVDVDSLYLTVNGDMLIWIPNTFTPDGDGLNDDFGPTAYGFMNEGYQMMIYDRWGKQLFYSNDYYHRWNGTVEGELIKSNYVYVYVIYIRSKQGKEFMYKGRITLVGNLSN
jgi:gliding motility-associated-like protein